ncbi:ABC transporter ATP-binding protein [Bacillus methanolicus]|uniref:ABC superfamily ATP binding cassette transporter, ABC/membrane protein n=1 Tax=Bacillus methanolicus (strain MGA3 / ATCC 53907) TaxID=796606 RepID=I3E3X7_BACMM|nr:ABC transporter ATP-binding protein [Bacillus methanolicus]AIE58698.1 ABC superfamily ATP binding cassette transporter, ABC/membrane protein [Bacillus methanolicus MGA3]EIJ81198.1 ABC transporter related protein [Bacillus methanolicus MGA3]
MLKLFRYLKAYRVQVFLAIFLVFLQTLSELYLPNLMSDIVDKGVVNGDIPYIWKIGGFMLLVAAGGTICSIVASFFTAKSATGFGKTIRSKVFTHVETFSQEEFDKIGTSSLITRTTNDIFQVQQVLTIMLRMMVMAPLMCIGGIIMALSRDVKLSWVFVVSIPILLLVIIFVQSKAIPLFQMMQKKLDNLNRVMRENLTGIRVIRAFSRIDFEKKRFDHANLDVANTAIRVNKIVAVMMPAMMLILNFSTIAIVWFGGIRINDGDMQVGDLMAFIQYAMQIMFSFIMMSVMFIMIPRASVSAVRINEVLEIKTKIVDPEVSSKSDDTFHGVIEFQDVSFRYANAENPVLSNISFKAEPGEVTAIIGGTGSGKSTLLSLIPRFYDVSSGRILIDGIDVKEMNQQELRKKIGYVPQKAVLFTGTIAENIRFGKEDASDEEVEHAARIAQAASFISEMKDGFQSMISQGGTNLSGGQKQRLSIARALVRKPVIYLFDDSFSALDFKTDAALRKALKGETKDATVLIVAQRVSTVMDADQIIVLEEGKIAGIGTHHELLKSCDVYREIVSSQITEEEVG